MHWRTIVQFHIRNKLLTTNLYWCNLDIFCGLLYYTTRMMTILTLYFWMKSDVVVYVHTINWYWWKFGILFENCSDQLLRFVKKIVLVIKANFKAKGQEFESILRPLKQFIQMVKGQNNFWYQNAFLSCSWRFLISNKGPYFN